MNEDFSHLLGLHYVFNQDFAPYQILTHLFVHGGFMHLFSNMLSLFFFGPLLESYFGTKRFLIFYLVCGFGASVLYTFINYMEISQVQAVVETYLSNPNPDSFTILMNKYGMQVFKYEAVIKVVNDFAANASNQEYIESSKEFAKVIFQEKSKSVLIGASGAVFGILMAFGMLFPNMKLMLLFPPIPMKAKYFVALYAAYEIYAEIWTKLDDNIAHTAHLGGMLFAFILLKAWGLKAMK